MSISSIEPHAYWTAAPFAKRLRWFFSPSAKHRRMPRQKTADLSPQRRHALEFFQCDGKVTLDSLGTEVRGRFGKVV